MKNLFLTLSALIVMLASNAKADQIPQKEVVIGLSGAYVPGGFDSGSDAYFVVNGVFQNSCYKWKRVDVNNVGRYTHEIRSIASVSQGLCLMVLVPFQKEVRIGKMESGNHLLRFMNGDGTYFEKTMVVE